MRPDPHQIIQEMDADLGSIEAVDTLSERHGHAVWRVGTADRSYVLKWLPQADAEVEVQGALLLQELGVPILPLYGHTAQALLMEDLSHSDVWRLAVEADVARPGVGRAIADWYRTLHKAGEELLSTGQRPRFLARETDALDSETILATGRAVGLEDLSVWRLAADHIEMLKGAVGQMSATLNYNDFYWTNLALSRREDRPLEAIVFDYHLLGVGMRYSDVRNVTSSLSGEAPLAFEEVYGDIDPREEVLDRPLSTLYALTVAARLSTFPHWAEGSLDRVTNGDLERDLREAITLARSLL